MNISTNPKEKTMKKLKTRITAVALGVMCLSPVLSHAQMMKGESMMHDKMMTMDNMKQEMDAPTAIGGFCPVCLIHGMSMKGNTNYITTYKGKKYMFPGFEQQKAFIDNPEEYTKDIEMKYKQMMKK